MRRRSFLAATGLAATTRPFAEVSLMPSVTITHSDSSTETIDQTVGWTYKREIGKMGKLTIAVTRSDASSVTLEPKSDAVKLAGVTEGRLTDITKQGGAWQLVVRSFEWDARRESPTAGGVLKEGDDNAIITDLINDVPDWSVGSIADLTGPMSFVFNHAHRHEALRRVERNVPGELKFNSDGSVDYVSALGTDKSASITLSPSSTNVEGDLKVEQINREMDATHMRIIGAHEGEAQIFANLVPSADGASYDNRVNYTQPRWSDASDTDWGRVENKDVMSQSAVEEEAASIGDELTESLVEIKATVVGEDLALGDTVHVEKPESDVDRDMRVYRIKTKSEGATVRHDVLLSTRNVVRSDEANRLRDVQRFNVAFQGSSVAINVGPYKDAVDPSNNVEIPFYYPDLEYENGAEIQVDGSNYRIDSVGAAAGGDHSHLVDIDDITATNTDYGRVDERQASGDLNSPDGTFQLTDTYTPSVDTFAVAVYFSAEVVSSSSSTEDVTCRVEIDELNVTNEYIPDSNGLRAPGVIEQSEWATNSFIIPGDMNGIDLNFEVSAPSDVTAISWDLHWNALGPHQHDISVSETSDASGDHTHPPQTGIFTSSDTPSNVDVIVNGSTTDTNIGSGTFETTVDLSGEFNTDAWNTVELTSDSLGLLKASVFIEGYDQIGAN